MTEFNASEAPTTPPDPRVRRSFGSRHGRWMIPLGVIVLLILVGGGVVTVKLKSTARRIRSSEPYQHAVARAMANAQATKALGAPVVVGKMAVGDVAVRSDSGE